MTTMHSLWTVRMNGTLKYLFVIIGVLSLYLLFTYFPVICASFDDAKYVDGEVFTPADGEYDFRKFSLNSSKTRNYTTVICSSGYAQLIDDKGNHTINVVEWDKMTPAMRDMVNSTFNPELKRPSHCSHGIRIIDVDLYGEMLYASPAYDKKTNTLIYIATPSEDETVEMMETLEFRR